MEDRSASRSARSISPSTSAVHTVSRSKSRPPYENRFHHPLLATSPSHAFHPMPTQPSLSVIPNAVLCSTSGSSSDDRSSTQDSAIVIQSDPVPSCERSCAPRPCVHLNLTISRSCSPNNMPVTPRDPSLDALRRRKVSPSGPSISTLELKHCLPLLDTINEDVRWALSPDRSSTRSRSQYAGSYSGSASGSGYTPADVRSRGRATSGGRRCATRACRPSSPLPTLRHGCARPGIVAPTTLMAIPGAEPAQTSTCPTHCSSTHSAFSLC